VLCRGPGTDDDRVVSWYGSSSVTRRLGCVDLALAGLGPGGISEMLGVVPGEEVSGPACQYGSSLLDNGSERIPDMMARP
jgi:hypothetical protein